MEGISQEAIALAGHLKLKKLIVLFDDNGISIDGPLALADSVDQVQALRSRRLGGDAHRRPRSGGDCRGARSGEEVRAAVADRLPHHHRLRRADQGAAPRRPTARRSAPTKSPQRAQKLGWSAPAFEIPAPSSSRGAPPARAAAPARLAWQACASPPSIRQSATEFERRMRGELGERLGSAVAAREAKTRGSAEGDRNAFGFRIRARSLGRRRCRK